MAAEPEMHEAEDDDVISRATVRLQVQSSIHCCSTPRKKNSSESDDHPEEAEEVAGDAPQRRRGASSWTRIQSAGRAAVRRRGNRGSAARRCAIRARSGGSRSPVRERGGRASGRGSPSEIRLKWPRKTSSLFERRDRAGYRWRRNTRRAARRGSARGRRGRRGDVPAGRRYQSPIDEREGGQLDEAGPLKPRRAHAADQVRQARPRRLRYAGEVRAGEALAHAWEGRDQIEWIFHEEGGEQR